MSSTINDALEKSFDRLTRDSDTSILLMKVEDQLRASGRKNLADNLEKLQQDITAYYAGADTPDTQQGELTKPFVDAYEKITPQRLNKLLDETRQALTGNLKQEFAALENDAKIVENARPVSAPSPAKRTNIKP